VIRRHLKPPIGIDGNNNLIWKYRLKGNKVIFRRGCWWGNIVKRGETAGYFFDKFNEMHEIILNRKGILCLK